MWICTKFNQGYSESWFCPLANTEGSPGIVVVLLSAKQLDESVAERGGEVGVEDRVDARVGVGEHVGTDLK